MLELRYYQQRSLDALELYLRLAAQHGAKMAFIHQTDRPYRSVPALPELPYVCLRVPTGGGKTLMACHALGMASKELLQTEHAVCLWLVPSNTIRDQTLAALRDRRHPYRQAVESWFSGQVTVMDLTEALYVQRGTLDGETCIIVSTLQAFRIEDTEGRKVYESSGALMPHFDNLPAEIESQLERDEEGVIPYSLANVLRMRRPVVIMDEPHNARTPLSFDTLARFQPSCVVEFTATPETKHKPEKQQFASNVLYHVSAAELKLEDMIKLPVRLETRIDWHEVIADALAQRNRLEDTAKEEELRTGEYIRPVLLIQAEANRGEDPLTYEVIKQHLLENHRIPEDQIAIATGSTRQLDDVDLFDRECPLRYIITVQALKEGWDCSFAYVLCSVAEIGSSRAVEQLLGRILRLPRARRKEQDDLNHAFAFVASRRFFEAAQSLKDALIENGFQRMEAEQFVTPEQDRHGTLFGAGTLFPETSEPVSEPPDLSRLSESLANRIEYDEQRGTITVNGELDAAGLVELQECFETPEARAAIERLHHRSQGRQVEASAPSQTGMTFAVPQLALRVNGQLELFEEDHFLDVEWKLTDFDAALSEAEFPSEFVAGQTGELDVTDEGKIDVRFVDQMQRQLRMLGMEPGWDVPGLTNWIDRQIRHPDITRTQSSLFIRKAVESLLKSRGLTVEQLAHQKFRLKNALAEKIDQHRRAHAQRSFQQVLFENRAGDVEVSPMLCFHFRDGQYAPNWYYEGSYRFQKHLFPVVGELKAEGEEFDCAVFLDQLPKVSYWVRNLERRGDSAFWLQTSSDKFYPDFVAMLDDGRILIVEYKGEHLWSNDDSKEKRAVGELWAERSEGKCLFVMPKGPDWNAIQATIGT